MRARWSSVRKKAEWDADAEPLRGARSVAVALLSAARRADAVPEHALMVAAMATATIAAAPTATGGGSTRHAPTLPHWLWPSLLRIVISCTKLRQRSSGSAFEVGLRSVRRGERVGVLALRAHE